MKTGTYAHVLTLCLFGNGRPWSMRTCRKRFSLHRSGDDISKLRFYVLRRNTWTRRLLERGR